MKTFEETIERARAAVGPMADLRANGFDRELREAHRSVFGALWLPDEGRFGSVCIEPRDEEEAGEAREDAIHGAEWAGWPVEAA